MMSILNYPTRIDYRGTKYEEVQRKAREGDVVIFTRTTSDKLHNGRPYVVDREYSTLVVRDDQGVPFPVYNSDLNRAEYDVHVYAELDAEWPTAPQASMVARLTCMDGNVYDEPIESMADFEDMLDMYGHFGYVELPSHDHIHLAYANIASMQPITRNNGEDE